MAHWAKICPNLVTLARKQSNISGRTHEKNGQSIFSLSLATATKNVLMVFLLLLLLSLPSSQYQYSLRQFFLLLFRTPV
jgi:hypothetical protein